MNTSKEELIVLRPDNEDVSQEMLCDIIIDYRQNAKKIKKLTKVNEENKALLKKVSLNAYLEEYKLRGENPGSVIIEAKSKNDVKSFMFIPKDQYIQLKNKEDITELKEKYGESIIEKETSYKFNTKLFEKYRKLFEEFIEDSFEIDEEDKKEIIKKDEKISIKKGTIDNIFNISIESNEELEQVFEKINVVNNIKL